MTDADDRRLEQMEQLLRSAGPPPELPAGLASPPSVQPPKTFRLGLPRFQLALGFAAALVFSAFAIGYLVGGRGDRLEPVAELSMHAVSPASSASAELDVGEANDDGNVPIEMRVRGLPALPEGGWYELYLSRDGRPLLSCGTFTTDGERTDVRLSVGYALEEWREAGRYDGWVVTARIPGKPESSGRVLLTT